MKQITSFNNFFLIVSGFTIGVLSVFFLNHLAKNIIEIAYFDLSFYQLLDITATVGSVGIITYFLTKKFNRFDKHFQIHYDAISLYQEKFFVLCETIENLLLKKNSFNKSSELFSQFANQIIDVEILLSSVKNKQIIYEKYLKSIYASIELLWDATMEDNNNTIDYAKLQKVYYSENIKIRKAILSCKIALHS